MVPTWNDASRSPRRSSTASAPVSTRASSDSAREGTSTCWPSESTAAPGRSRTASRYESVATSRKPPSSDASSTPVRIGRASSELAAGTTCFNAAASSLAEIVSGSPAGSGNLGYSSAGRIRIVNSARPEVIRASSSSMSTTTAPAGKARTISAASRPGSTTKPSLSPLTLIDTSIVRSVSLPVSCNSLPASCARMPDNTGMAPPRVDTARPALPSASTNTSRSHRNFTATRFLALRFLGTAVGPVDCGQDAVRAGQRRNLRPGVVPSVAQSRGGAADPSGQPWNCPPRGPGLSPATHVRSSARPQTSCRVLDQLRELVHLVIDLALLSHQLLDLLDGVDHGGVIALAERLGDLGEAEVGHLAAHVHCDLAGVDQRPGAAARQQLVDRHAEHGRGRVQDPLCSDHAGLAIAQQVAEDLLGELQ